MEKKEKEVKIEASIPAVTGLNKNGFWTVKKTQQKHDEKFVDTFIQIPPFAIDDETGEILNKSAYPVLKPGEKFNFYDKIQSYKNDCDIYSILAQYAMTGDESLINQRAKTFADVFDIPDNIADLQDMLDKQADILKKYTDKQLEVIKNGNEEDLNVLVQDLVKQELIARGVLKEENVVKGENE